MSAGTNSKTYVDSVLKTGDSIYCVLASNAYCLVTSIVNSNVLKMTVSNPVTPTVNIAVSPGTSVCAGSKVTFTATAINGGTSPVYQWKKNGIIVGTNSKTYVDSILKNGRQRLLHTYQ
jgi:predicted deacylase